MGAPDPPSCFVCAEACVAYGHGFSRCAHACRQGYIRGRPSRSASRLGSPPAAPISSQLLSQRIRYRSIGTPVFSGQRFIAPKSSTLRELTSNSCRMVGTAAAPVAWLSSADRCLRNQTAIAEFPILGMFWTISGVRTSCHRGYEPGGTGTTITTNTSTGRTITQK